MSTYSRMKLDLCLTPETNMNSEKIKDLKVEEKV